jgi:plastocyanin
MKGTTMRRLFALTSVLLAAAFALAACGGGDESSTTAASSTTEATSSATEATSTTPDESFAVAADPNGQLAFTKTELSVPAGSVTVDFENASSTPHDVVVEDADGNELMHTDPISGSSATATADLQPGTYTFFCSVDSHREAGMEGTLTVK